MLSATVISWTTDTLWVLILFGALSFLLLIFVSRPRWTEGGAFGSANTVTAIRLGGVLVLPFFLAVTDPYSIAGIGLFLLLTDGLDGWMARRLNQASEFGEYFDKETDAFFLLVLCALAVVNQRLWPWVLIVGLLRYFFVVALHFLRGDFLKERKSSRAQFVYLLVIVAMLFSFLPFPKIYRPFVVIATLALIWSFVRDFRFGLQKNQPHPSALFPSIPGKLHRLKTKTVHSTKDVQAFFDGYAHDLATAHGDSPRQFHYRLGRIKEALRLEDHHVLLDIGCGIGHYLLAMTKDIGRGIGVDFSEEMIALAKEATGDSPFRERLTYIVDRGEQLSTIEDASVDRVMCIGALEHMPGKEEVLAMGHRVLRPGGRIVLLTPNGDHIWYRSVAPALGLDTKHLSTDSFLRGREVERLLRIAGFRGVSIDYWTFIPNGDMHPVFSVALEILDRVGTLFQIGSLRGGLLVTARKH
jgi:2-polyprenyl-6-hydroxyphenyl methylase/3-demethylubiquinone-9 3-methyltransferase